MDFVMASPSPRGFVFDFDNTIYHETEGVSRAWTAAFIKIIQGYGLNLSDEQITHLRDESYKKYGSSIRGFCERFPKHDEKEVYLDICQAMDKNTIAVCGQTTQFLSDCSDQAPIAILSSGICEWVVPTLEYLGYDRFFKTDRVITYNKTKGALKSTSEVPFLMAADALGLPVCDLVMVEDHVANLVVAKELGMTTVLITHGKATDPRDYPYIDYIVPKVYDIPAVLPGVQGIASPSFDS